MNNNIDYIKLRNLLDKWYEGSASPAEESELIEMIKNASELPDEFNADRELILGLNAFNVIVPEMPEKYASRISAELDKEISKDEREGVQVIKRYFSNRRFVWWSACSVLLLFGCISLLKSISVPITPTSSFAESEKPERVKEATVGFDTIIHQSLLAVNSESNVNDKGSDKQSVKKRTIARSNESVSADANSIIKESRNSEAESADELSVTKEGEVNVIPAKDVTNHHDAANESYNEPKLHARMRVIKDEEEANQIINSLFSHYASVVSYETMTISKIELECNAELSRASVLQNINALRDYHHEKHPI